MDFPPLPRRHVAPIGAKVRHRRIGDDLTEGSMTRVLGCDASIKRPRPDLKEHWGSVVRLFQLMSVNQACFLVATMARVLGVLKAGY